jgi:hypothetical protein
MPAIGHQGFVSVPDTDASAASQTTHLLYRLVGNATSSNNSTRPFAFSLAFNEAAQDITGFASTAPVVRSQQPSGIAEWSGTITGYYPKTAPLSGHVGNVTFGDGFDTCPRSFSIDFQWESFEQTCMGSTAPEWMEHRPGLGSGTGAYQCLVPVNAPLTLVGQTGTAEFRIANTGTPCTIEGSIHINSASVGARIGENVVVDYGFTFNGNATFTGTAGNSLLANGTTLIEPQETEVKFFTVNSTEGFTGRCFLTGMSISVAIGSPIEVNLTLQGTGDLTVA